jgi:RNA polymerase sigma-70 factor, ECF subfamily
MSGVPQEFGGWLSAARAGSRDALGTVLETCRRYLLSIARHELTDDLRAKGGASDLVQDTFLDAHRAFEHFQGNSEGELQAWLRRLLHHRAAKFGRRYRTTQKRRLAREASLSVARLPAGDETGPRTELPSPSTQVMAHEQAQQLGKALERLPEDYRQAITLRYVEQCSFVEIGRLMKRTPNAARLLWLRAIERIKHELRDADES